MLLAKGAPSDKAVICPVVLMVEFVVDPGPPRLGFSGDSVEFAFVTLLMDPCPLSFLEPGTCRRRA